MNELREYKVMIPNETITLWASSIDNVVGRDLVFLKNYGTEIVAVFKVWHGFFPTERTYPTEEVKP